MSYLRVPTTRVPVEIKFTDGRSLEGEIFLPSYSARRPGPMRPDEWCEAANPFFPFQSPNAGDLTLVNRDTVVYFTVPAEAIPVDDEPASSRRLRRLAIEVGGERFEGEVVVEMPADRSRVADWLNAPGAFITITSDDATRRLIKKRHVTRVIELPAPV